ncbi:BgtE-5659 [Blumeria graminis f. sp. tritici]|uniref:BgtE-5659 n=3 Tax=Blumeria graminis TaxID=34373 RepID=A0A061HCG7_BLUGR|nr:putative secreted effector protein [Blumeria graminis f. sp. tritici 96224]VDB84199.1 BgtE-5659 [Blumeria graminis f. sp. tritici]
MHIWSGILAVTAVLLYSIPTIYAHGENIVSRDSEIICGHKKFSYLEVTASTTVNYHSGQSFPFKGRARCGTVGAAMWRTPLHRYGKKKSTGCFVIFDSSFKIVDIIFDLKKTRYKPCYIHRQNVCPDNRGNIEDGAPVATHPDDYAKKSLYHNDFSNGMVGNAYVMGVSWLKPCGVGPAFLNEHDQTITFFQHG